MGFTNNYCGFMGMAMADNASGYNMKNSVGQTVESGNFASYGTNAFFDVAATNNLTFNTTVMNLGTGSTPEAATDYCIETDVTSSFSDITATIIKNAEPTIAGVMVERNFVWSGRNNTASDILVSEICLGDIKQRGGGFGKQYYVWYRKVLDTPVTVPAGKLVTFTVTFTM